jgi:hypothetical protein
MYPVEGKWSIEVAGPRVWALAADVRRPARGVEDTFLRLKPAAEPS